MRLDVHCIPAQGPWAAHVDAIRAAEDAGFDTAWVVDHLSGAPFGGVMYEAFTQLGALAAVTSRIGLGVLVANVTNRLPGMLAVSAASVQAMSGGRFVLGLGAGTSPGSPFAGEQHAIGNRPPATLAERHARLLATLDQVRALWAAPPDGFLRPDPIPPVLLGVNSMTLARLAGEHADGVNVRWNHPDRAAILRAARDARGERTGWWTTSVWVPWDAALADPANPLLTELIAEGVDRVVLMWTAPPTIAEVARFSLR